MDSRAPRPRPHCSLTQDLNLAITYQVTNSSDFKMEKDVMLTTVAMEETGVFYVQVEWGIRGPKVRDKEGPEGKEGPERNKPLSRPR